MTEPEKPPVETTAHEWDGIRELDNPLPRWWLWTYYASIVAAAVYWVMMPAWPGISGYTKGLAQQSDRRDVVRAMDALQRQRGAEGRRLAQASLETIERDPKMQEYALAVGQSVFGDNCATCHGAGGTGGVGYANLRDDVWLWGGAPDQILHTITVGVRSGAEDRTTKMPAFGRDAMLTAHQIDDLTGYVTALSGGKANAAAVERARPLVAAQCASCHGADGRGNQQKGAPNLTDKEWLYGGSPAAIRSQIWSGRGGVMPAWGHRFDEPTLKALAVYIHANAGGQ
jgi:cytochrome c oxidase cbb3-type subunit 3